MSAADGLIRLSFDSRAYQLLTIQKAAIKFTNQCSFDFEVRPDGQIEVGLTVPATRKSPDIGDLVQRFKAEVLDQHLRAIVAKETEAERTLILAYAFSNTKLIRS